MKRSPHSQELRRPCGSTIVSHPQRQCLGYRRSKLAIRLPQSRPEFIRSISKHPVSNAVSIHIPHHHLPKNIYPPAPYRGDRASTRSIRLPNRGLQGSGTDPLDAIHDSIPVHIAGRRINAHPIRDHRISKTSVRLPQTHIIARRAEIDHLIQQPVSIQIHRPPEALPQRLRKPVVSYLQVGINRTGRIPIEIPCIQKGRADPKSRAQRDKACIRAGFPHQIDKPVPVHIPILSLACRAPLRNAIIYLIERERI